MQINNNRPTDFTDDIKNWWDNCKFFNRWIIIISTSIYIISFFYEPIIMILANFPVVTIFRL